MNYINNINMKQIYILLVTICAIAFTACSKDDDSSEDGKEGVITLVHRTDYSASSPVRIQIGAFNKGDIITIDWGDGNVENANLETMCDNIFSTYGIGHRYPNSNPYIITIKGKIRGFWCYTKHITSFVIVKTCSDSLFSIGQKNCQLFVAKLRNFLDSHNRMVLY